MEAQLNSENSQEHKEKLIRFAEITLEFLSVAFHNILYNSSIYPKSIFEPRRKYNIVVYQSIHPEINSYILLVLKNIEKCLMMRALNRIEFVLTDNKYSHIKSIMFDFKKIDISKVIPDAYVINLEQNIRAILLKLSSASDLLKESLPKDASFCIRVHTNNNAKVAMSLSPELNEMPVIEEIPQKTDLIEEKNMYTLVENFGSFHSEAGDQLDVHLNNYNVDCPLLSNVMLTF